MGETGILAPGTRVELIDGEIIDKAPITSLHAGTVNQLNQVLLRAVGDKAIVSVQNPVELSNRSEPEPDLKLLRWRDDFYRKALPLAGDVLLAIEVADSTLSYDLGVKGATVRPPRRARVLADRCERRADADVPRSAGRTLRRRVDGERLVLRDDQGARRRTGGSIRAVRIVRSVLASALARRATIPANLESRFKSARKRECRSPAGVSAETCLAESHDFSATLIPC